MQIQLDIAQFNHKPVIINLFGNCLPGIAKEEVLAIGEAEVRRKDGLK
jgi:hypothetical protein